KAGRLAGAGLGPAHHVFAGKNQGNRLRLDRRGRGVTGFGHGAEQFRPQTELSKTRGTTHQIGLLDAPARYTSSGPGGDATDKERAAREAAARRLGGDRNGRRMLIM